MPISNRKFHKTVIHYEILSEEPFSETNLLDIYNRCEDDCSGRLTFSSHAVLDGEQAASALLEQGSEPEFFQLTENGSDIGDEESPILE